MPKFYIESGEWKNIVIAPDFINATLRVLREHIEEKDCRFHNLGNTILVNQGGYIGDLYDNDDENREVRIEEHRVLIDLTIAKALALVEKSEEDIVFFLPTKKVLKLLELCEGKCVEHLTHEDCQGLKILE